MYTSEKMKAKKTVNRGIVGRPFDECLSVMQSSPHFPPFIIPFHSSMSCVWSISSSSRFTSSSHPNALRLAPPQRSRLLVTAGQCANQLAPDKCVYVLEQVTPNSLSSGTGALLPCNCRSQQKRCTELSKFKLRKFKPWNCEHRNVNREMIQLSNIDKQIPQTRDGRTLNDEQRRRVSMLRKCRIKHVSQKRKGNQTALKMLKASGQTCCSRSQVLESVVEYYQDAKKVSKPNRKKIRRNERKQAFHRLRNGTVFEYHMSKEEKRCHEKRQKNVQSKTRRCLSYVIKNMGKKAGGECKEEQLSTKGSTKKLEKRNQHKLTSKKSKNSPAEAKSDTKKSNKQSVQEINKVKIVDHSVKDKCGRQCWLCDEVIGKYERILTCDTCNIWYHVNCMGFANIEHLATNSVSWMCSKCGRCNYCVSFLYDLGIPTDENVFQILLTEVGIDEESVRVHGENVLCTEGIKEIAKNGIEEITMVGKTLMEEA